MCSAFCVPQGGFEPPQAEPESAVLPLHNRGIYYFATIRYLTGICQYSARLSRRRPCLHLSFAARCCVPAAPALHACKKNIRSAHLRHRAIFRRGFAIGQKTESYFADMSSVFGSRFTVPATEVLSRSFSTLSATPFCDAAR